MPFRAQDYREPCRRCQQPSAGVCPRCSLPMCERHRFPPDGCCEPCAIDIFAQMNRAGKKQLTIGSVMTGVVAGLAYFCWQIGFLPASMVAFLLVGFGLAGGTLAWGGMVAPRLTDRKLRKQLAAGQARALPAAVDVGKPS